ncbi:transporter [Methyloligella sp. GL2]|nr:transporter [Methyloligella sp. GL2]
MKAASCAFVAAGLFWTASPAQAQTTFDVIGPKEYDLPVDFDPFNVFVQYAYVQNNDHVWDVNGNKVAGDGSQSIVGLSKFVHFWTPSFSNKIGLAYEVIQPEIAIRNRGAADPDGRHVSGFGDTLTGFATWYKPTPESTLGIQSFLQIPWGDKDVSDTNWKNLTSLLWYTPLIGKFDWTGDAGFVWQSTKDNGLKPGTTFHTNNRFGYQMLDWLEPYIALDYEHTDSYSNVPKSWGLDGGLGVMVSYAESSSLAVRYSKSLNGENHAYNDSWNLRYIYAW